MAIGATFGHSLCTGLTCCAGKMISDSVSERFITFVAGAFFLAFGIVDLIVDDF